MKSHVLVILVSGLLVLGLFRAVNVSLAYNGTPTIPVPYGVDVYGNVLGMQFDIYGPNDWHYSGYSFTYTYAEPAWDIANSNFHVPFPWETEAVFAVNLPQDGDYRCVGCFNLTGETHEETKHFAYDPAHPMGYNGYFNFTFGSLLNPVQVAVDTYELGTRPTWTSEEHVGSAGHDAGNAQWHLGDWVMLKNITCYKAYYQILNMGTGIAGVSMTLDYFKQHLAVAFADSIGIAIRGWLVYTDKLFVPTYVKYRIIGDAWCDGNFPCGMHQTPLSEYTGPAYALVIDEMIGQCAWFGHDCANIETGFLGQGTVTMSLLLLADEQLQGSIVNEYDTGVFLADALNITQDCLGLPMGVSGRDSPLGNAFRFHYTGYAEDWSGCTGPVPWDNCYLLHGVPDNGGFPMMPQWGAGSVSPVVIPPVVHLPVVGDVPTIGLVLGGVGLVAAVAVVIVLVRKKHL